MALRPILLVPDPRLKSPAAPVATVDDGVRRLLDDMLETMYAAPGIGLAAPQVGELRRLVVVDVGEPEARRPLRLVNPEIVWHADEREVLEEGCLSLPEVYAEVERPVAVAVRYRDERGEERELRADGLLGRALQHELDHLDGRLFVDRISTLKRGMLLRKFAKAQRGRSRSSA